jgi:hypothetical protein
MRVCRFDPISRIVLDNFKCRNVGTASYNPIRGMNLIPRLGLLVIWGSANICMRDEVKQDFVLRGGEL